MTTFDFGQTRSNDSDLQSTSKIRHSLSSALSFVETAIRNLSSERPDLPQALHLHSIGTSKLKEALRALDRLTDLES